METLNIDGLEVLAERPAHARGGPVLLVHGMFANASMLSPWLPRLAARGHTTYAVSLRGHGGSCPEPDLGSVSLDDYTDDVSTVLRRIGCATIVGHSMGGLVAQKVAERGEAQSTVLISSAPPRGITVLTPRLILKQAKYMPAILRRKPIVPDREDLRDLTMNHVPADEQDALLDMLGPDSGYAGWQMSITGVPVDARRITCPMLVVTGDDDRFVPAGVARRIAARYHAPLHTFPGHGHMIMAEPQWTVVVDLVARWVAEHST